MLYIVLVINVISMVAMIAGILMHSGRGGGLSDMFGGGGSAALGSSAAERNLNRLTTVFALIWVRVVVFVGWVGGVAGGLVVAGGVEGEGAEEFACCGVDDADLEVVDEDQD